MSGEVYLMWLLSLIQTLSAYGADLSSEACRELGFSSNLLCSSLLPAGGPDGGAQALPWGHPGGVWMKTGEVPSSPSFCQERQAEDVQGSSDQVRERLRSCAQAFGR
ncbi:hypothetical protein OJAV_G00167470 [Xyrichtys novacula]|uniref:Uncharacterized protein n=1 Tax=Xyrichtys novacula TaxID=13765 RepID=A0AAV1GEQ9_XYRNO|nr:hypothetical protein OJAV_G00167470 [Xyrichtys novacula]